MEGYCSLNSCAWMTTLQFELAFTRFSTSISADNCTTRIGNLFATFGRARAACTCLRKSGPRRTRLKFTPMSTTLKNSKHFFTIS